MIKKNNLWAFSLIELMVVVAIIGIIGMVAIPSYKNHIQKTKIMKAYVTLTDIAKDIMITYNRTNQLPSSIIAFDTVIASGSLKTGAFEDLSNIYFAIQGTAFVVDGSVSGLDVPNPWLRVYGDLAVDNSLVCGAPSSRPAYMPSSFTDTGFLYSSSANSKSEIIPEKCRQYRSFP